MTLRVALLLLFVSLSAGCVLSGDFNPMKTSKGRDEAREAYVQLGLGYLQQGMTERAKVPLKKALELDESDADANAALALVFQAEMEPELADQHYRKALAARPSDARILNNYGSFLFEEKRYKDAYQRFEQAAADTLYPERSRVFENLGMTAAMLGERDLARQHLEKALRLNRQQPRALLEMAELSFEDRHYVPARDYYDRFSLLSEQNARSLLLGVRLATVFEDRDKAASYGLQLKRLYPGTPEYQQYLSEQ
ncbi:MULTISPECIES: type IV pilus biogenesis/stability protein PilW [Pseudomonas]|uniref:Type IV pilus biogenesis/stability protein PilW n=1 Tax=Pseudomonas chlororaphis TaxID=587753 RepID=A0AB34BZD1_9PSED|nr:MULTISPECIES: type IV pilus biogenesis/stability protein PilW [Pseudomonas]AMS16269.1 type IV pilus biogenesis/stability protein PilW [Pseudomonas chlororaphis]AZD04239.1 Type IV pilus biogenesis protein PilF [Pseudomonas chlororaphis subsp. chlororaphis]KAA5838891.1 type IV pilus biogenesis/stability protein PilW [Pseudomonas chlororaphis]MBM0281322.1 type IV pilus biogenesis/stability protein PilW [Pseudomonas chlororaphis]MDO1502934.1 type IV pilus biogenesis/stability protein PilW [Pseu